MRQILDQLDTLRHLNVTSLTHWVDILLVTFLIYRLLLLIKGTQAWRIVFGIAGFVILLGLSKFLQLDTLNYILDKATLLAPVAIAIIFLPELRQALEGFGKLLPQKLGSTERTVESHTIEEIVAAAAEMSEGKIGALIIIEREAKLDAIIANGTSVDAQISAALLGAIFYEGNPLHDGAAIIRGSRVAAAACRLPLSESSRIDTHVHMRHRAAVGITETNDSIAVVVSEERGKISVANEGVLSPLSGSKALREYLTHEFWGDETEKNGKKPRVKRLAGSFSRGSHDPKSEAEGAEPAPSAAKSSNGTGEGS